MGMLNSVTAMIDRYGNSVTVKNGGINVKTRAFVEPLRYKNRIYCHLWQRTSGDCPAG